MRLALRIVVTVLALLTLAAPVASADQGRGGGHRHPRVVPVDRVAGSTGGRILGDVFVENLSRPASASPFGGTVNLCLDVGRRDRVLVPAGGVQDDNRVIEMTCTVELGRPVVLVLPTADCSTAEEPPFYAATAKEQRACAIEQIEPYVKALGVSVDGGKAKDVLKPRFFEVSSQRRVVLPQDAVFGAKPGPATFVAAGWLAQIRDLGRGSHTVTSTATLQLDSTTTVVDTFVVHLEVVGRHHH